MNCTLLRLGGCAILLAGLIASPGRADLISGSVSFDPGLSTTKVYANGGVDPDKAPGIAFKNWSDYDFSHQSLPAKGQFAGALDVFGLGKGKTAHFGANGSGTPFSLTFDIHDGSNPGAITFTGLLFGDVKRDAHGNETSSVRIDWLGPTTKTLDIDHHIYALSVSDLLQAGTFPDSKGVGLFDVGVQVSHNPEPASLVLAALGVVPLGLTWLRRKRRTRAG
jgi:hypothetical protein